VPQQDDWSVQLKKIEREFEGLPPEPSPAYKKLQSEEERRAQERAQQRAAMFGGGARLILVFALFVALALWPYERACGVGLFEYLGVELVIIVGGLWVAFTTWRHRLPKMHTLSLLIVLTGLVLMATEILPRIGYAAVDPKHPPQFSCPETQNPAPRTSSTQNPAPRTSVVAQPVYSVSRSPMEERVQAVARSMEDRWQESTGELSRKFRPQRDALAKIERPELLSNTMSTAR